jgi:hypothetical protein
MRQNQVIAIEKGAKVKAERALTDSHHRLEQAALLTGLTRVYTPRDEDGEKQPPEKKLVQCRATEEMAEIMRPLAAYFDVTATKSITNTIAKADVLVDGAIVVENAPVDLLLFLEKQLVNIHTYVAKLPALDPSEDWKWDDNRVCYVTDTKQQMRTKKLLRNHVKAEATPQHPAQVEIYTEDVQIGTWNATKMSGAMPGTDKLEILERVEKLQAAVKQAREQANMTETKMVDNFGGRVLRFLFEGAKV